jgi:hypothetical protein
MKGEIMYLLLNLGIIYKVIKKENAISRQAKDRPQLARLYIITLEHRWEM